MRMIYIFFALLSLLIFSTFPHAEAVIEPEEAMPDAMSRLLKAPDIDIENIRDPFLSSFAKMRMEEASRFKKSRGLPIDTRKREPLELYDLSALTLVATYKRQNKDWVASIQDSKGQSFTVHRGSYIGKNSGRIEKIDNKTVYLVEQALDPAGMVVDQQVTITLEEVNKSAN